MRWYEGGIANAVTLSKTKQAVFVVYLEGQDDKSLEITRLLDDIEISNHLQSDYFVAIKVIENSLPHQQFQQIYKDAVVPSVYFIGNKSGSPLAIIKEPCSSIIFVEKLKQILESSGVNTNDHIVNETTENSQHQTSTAASEDVPSTSNNEQTNLSADEKAEKTKQLIVQKLDAKREEEDEKAKSKEVERRKVGQDIQKFKRWQQDNELKELMEQRNKEKVAQQKAKQRVLDQIAQDKAERAAKFSNINPPTHYSSHSTNSSVPNHRSTDNSKACLQLRLPDGGFYTQEFSSSSTLQDVRNYIVSNINLPFQNFTLSTTFPRREFTIEDFNSTLLSLELVPNAVILVLPIHHGAVSTNTNSWYVTLFWSLIGPLLNFVSYVKNYIFPSAETATTKSPSAEKRSNETSGESYTSPKRRAGESTVVRRQGNVHRLTDKADSDDDNNTWNGNSTQQM